MTGSKGNKAKMEGREEKTEGGGRLRMRPDRKTPSGRTMLPYVSRALLNILEEPGSLYIWFVSTDQPAVSKY